MAVEPVSRRWPPVVQLRAEYEALKAEAAAAETQELQERENAARATAERARARAGLEAASARASRTAEKLAARCRDMKRPGGGAWSFAGSGGGFSRCDRSLEQCDQALAHLGRASAAVRGITQVANASAEVSAEARKVLERDVLFAQVLKEEEILSALRRQSAEAEVELRAEEVRLATLQEAFSDACNPSPSATSQPNRAPSPIRLRASSAAHLHNEELAAARHEYAEVRAEIAVAREQAVQREREVAHLQSACEFARSLAATKLEQLPDKRSQLKKSLQRMLGDVSALQASCREGARRTAEAEAQLQALCGELKVERTVSVLAELRDAVEGSAAAEMRWRVMEEFDAITARAAEYVSNFEDSKSRHSLETTRATLAAVRSCPPQA